MAINAPYSTYSQVPGFSYPEESFAVGLFDVGDLNGCLFSYFCAPCALGQSRVYLDNSEFLFNCFCLPLAPYRWMVRSAYNIGDRNAFIEDLIVSLFCPCCTINQLYQTTHEKGNPSVSGGRRYNRTFHNTIDTSIKNVACAACCLPCFTGKMMQDSIRMPYFLGFLCVNPFQAHNILRYQYRIEPKVSDTFDECVLPYVALPCCASVTQTIFSCSAGSGGGVPLGQILVSIAMIYTALKTSSIIKMYGEANPMGYLVGYEATQSQYGAVPPQLDPRITYLMATPQQLPAPSTQPAYAAASAPPYEAVAASEEQIQVAQPENPTGGAQSYYQINNNATKRQ